jgi:hypothetical protein
MKHNKTVVNHWRYEDGWRDTPQVFRSKDPSLPEREFSPEIIGWHCWVYPTDDQDFEGWMEQNMKGEVDVTHRFNSGNPMYTVMIKDDQDATLFKLTWM